MDIFFIFALYFKENKARFFPSARRDQINSIPTAHYFSKGSNKERKGRKRMQEEGACLPLCHVFRDAEEDASRRNERVSQPGDSGDARLRRHARSNSQQSSPKTGNLQNCCKIKPISDLSCQYINKAFFQSRISSQLMPVVFKEYGCIDVLVILY